MSVVQCSAFANGVKTEQLIEEIDYLPQETYKSVAVTGVIAIAGCQFICVFYSDTLREINRNSRAVGNACEGCAVGELNRDFRADK